MVFWLNQSYKEEREDLKFFHVVRLLTVIYFIAILFAQRANFFQVAFSIYCPFKVTRQC
jgi:hypothetical protein